MVKDENSFMSDMTFSRPGRLTGQREAAGASLREHQKPRQDEVQQQRRQRAGCDREDRLNRGRSVTGADQQRIDTRSEEHTSELQSLMRISYAVFCLKKKKQNKANQYTS